jgi:predicted DNA-binding transcriptional regulator YafY
MAYRVYDEFDATSVQKEKDGTLLVTTCWPYDSWVAGYVLSFGPSVTVVEPQCLRDEIHEMAKKLCELYKT